MPEDATIEPKKRNSFQSKAEKAKKTKATKKKRTSGGRGDEDEPMDDPRILNDEENDEPETEGRVKGLRFTRTQIPLQPALWRTTHSIQGVSADFAAVKPPDTGFAVAKFGVRSGPICRSKT